MNVPYTRAPHQSAHGLAGPDLHAALLIDFDNVTMGMRSDLSKELKSLLDSDVIKGKVSVQRAYADWRRYPQYIVPLSEASVDLIFAPAYGSNKKNATDIRMAIDALELVFIRPEIGTYILLTGDSDFSSLVLKLKEYGKYVIGVGIQESSSDILVQNCDEYYSYTSLTGLTKTTDLNRDGKDPWVLVRDSVEKMVKRGDVMRSDRLKQVMQEIDPTFDEGAIGFSKFSKFLAEASSRGLLRLRKLENGQYEVEKGSGRPSTSSSEGRSRSRRGGRSRGGRSRGGESRRQSSSDAESDSIASSDSDEDGDPLGQGYDLLTEALTALREAGREPVRDSDVKRKMLERDRGFDETEMGFPKFSKFLDQASRDGIITLSRSDAGNLDVTLADSTELGEDVDSEKAMATGDGRADTSQADRTEVRQAPPKEAPAREERTREEPASEAPVEPTVVDVEPPRRGLFGFRLGPRRGSTRRRGGDAASLFGGGGTPAPTEDGAENTSKGTGVAATEADTPDLERELAAEYEVDILGIDEETVDYGDGDTTETEDDRDHGREASTAPAASEPSAPVPDVPIDDLALPSESGAIVRYLTHRYKGVGEKTAQALVERLGPDLFKTLHEKPESIADIVPPARAEQVLAAWKADYERRVGLHAPRSEGNGSGGGRRGGRSRSRGRSGS
jgi:uncharacterized protein (TIGR00288 family)